LEGFVTTRLWALQSPATQFAKIISLDTSSFQDKVTSAERVALEVRFCLSPTRCLSKLRSLVMRVVSKFLAVAMIATVLGFAPFAFGQSANNSAALHVGSGLHVANLVMFLQGWGGNGGGGNGGGGNGCGEGGNGGGGWGGNGGGNGGGGWGGNGGGGGCGVPEGGSALTYIALAGLCCAAAAAFRFRRSVSVSASN
jgi:hypothetical protein